MQYLRLFLPLLLTIAGCSDDTTGQSSSTAADLGSDTSIEADAALAVDMGSDASARQDLGVDMDSMPDMSGVPFQSGIEVDTTLGTIRGESDGDLRVFRGIPYAQPPVGENRLRAPQSALPWEGTLEADEFGDSCPQAGFTVGDQSEDCLTLNVWAHSDERERPVMVWIYGGGFIIGESALATYEGADLAEDADVVVVTVNYRLGILGNLALPELRDEDALGAVGNMGLLDQIEALNWIRANAAAFGGDPQNITVFGESAGAISTCALMGSPLADDLFDKAIMQSGNCALFGTTETGALGQPGVFEFGESVTDELGCADAADRLACLRGLPTEDFVDAIDTSLLSGGLLSSEVSLGPTVDGVVLPELPYERIVAGRAPDRPLIAGSNGNEGALFTASEVVLTRSDFADKLEPVFEERELAEDVVDLYSFAQFPLAKDAYNAFVGELLFNCNSFHTAREMNGYYYYLMQGPTSLMTPYGPLHAADLFYVFGNFFGVVPTLLDFDLSRQTQLAWGAFARTGEPSWEGGWPIAASDGEYLQIDLVPGVEDDFRRGRCDELQNLGVLP